MEYIIVSFAAGIAVCLGVAIAIVEGVWLKHYMLVRKPTKIDFNV